MRLRLLPHQLEFVTSKATHTGLVAGFGSGKTYAGLVKTLLKKLEMPDVNVAYYLPTYRLLKDIALPRIKEMAMDLGLATILNYSDMEAKIWNGNTYIGKIIFRTMENKGRYIIGYEVGYSLVDEADEMPYDDMTNIFKKIIARNRTVSVFTGDANQVDMVGTPNGFGFLYDFFVRKKSEKKKLIQARSIDNPYLPKDYIDMLFSNYDERTLKAYVNGEFVNLTSGQVFHTYNRVRHRTGKSASDFSTLIVGMDFNVGNMNAVVFGNEKGILYAVDEITGVYNTFDMAAMIRKRYPNRRIIVYPDASGKARHTSAVKTDIEILRENGLLVKVAKNNPPVRDRINETNKRFELGKLFVNDVKCYVFSEALEKLTWKDGKIDKISGLDHIVDAGTYPVWHLRVKKFDINV